MTYTLDGFSFEGEEIENEVSYRISKHEILNSSTIYLKNTGQEVHSIAIRTIQEDDGRTSLKAKSLITTDQVFSDDVTSIMSINVKLQSYKEKQLAPGIWEINLVLESKVAF